jgi:hypothetical protein
MTKEIEGIRENIRVLGQKYCLGENSEDVASSCQASPVQFFSSDDDPISCP